VIQTTAEQRASVLNALRSPGRILKEKVWTYLVADILDNAQDQAPFLELLCGRGFVHQGARLEPWFEAQPISPRLGTRGKDHESNSKIDLAFGAVVRRGTTGNGIAFDDTQAHKWVCFVEGKFLEDAATRITNDPYRNQLERDIDSLLCFLPSGSFPDMLHFTILTPRKFKERPRSRLYGYRIEEYWNDRSLIVADLAAFELGYRTKCDDVKRFLEEQVEALEIHWAAYEQILELAFGLQSLDLLARTRVRALEVELDRVANDLEARLRADIAPGGLAPP
jgi:hypothetical protein